MEPLRTLENIGENISIYKKKEGNDQLRLVRCPNFKCDSRILVYVSKKTEFVDCDKCDCRIKLKRRGGQ